MLQERGLMYILGQCRELRSVKQLVRTGKMVPVPHSEQKCTANSLATEQQVEEKLKLWDLMEKQHRGLSLNQQHSENSD